MDADWVQFPLRPCEGALSLTVRCCWLSDKREKLTTGESEEEKIHIHNISRLTTPLVRLRRYYRPVIINTEYTEYTQYTQYTHTHAYVLRVLIHHLLWLAEKSKCSFYSKCQWKQTNKFPLFHELPSGNINYFIDTIIKVSPCVCVDLMGRTQTPGWFKPPGTSAAATGTTATELPQCPWAWH